MNLKKDIIISIVLLILIIIYKIYQNKKYKLEYKSNLYYKNKNLVKTLIILSIILSTSYIIYTYYIKELNIINGISIFILIFPISIINLYKMIFKDEEKYNYIKTIITKKIPSKETIKKYIISNMNVIIFNKEKPNYKIKELTYDDIDKKSIQKSFYINEKDPKIVTKYLKEEEYIIDNNIDKLYEKIIYSRGINDNYTRSLKYIIISYLSLLLANIVLLIAGFPLLLNPSIILVFKFINLLEIEFLISKYPFDKDIKNREVKDNKKIFDKQEFLFMIIHSILVLISITLPYMYFLSGGVELDLIRTIFLNIYIFSMLLINYYYYSEDLIIINIIKGFRNIRASISLIISIILILVFNFIKVFYISYESYINIFASLVVSLIFICFSDIVKIARWFSIRKRNKHVKDN